MDLALLVYGISLLDRFHGMLLGGFVICVILTIIIYACRFAEYSDESYHDDRRLQRNKAGREYVAKHGPWAIIGAVVLLSIAIIIPSERTAYMMVGAYSAQKVYENQQNGTTYGHFVCISALMV